MLANRRSGETVRKGGVIYAIALVDSPLGSLEEHRHWAVSQLPRGTSEAWLRGYIESGLHGNLGEEQFGACVWRSWFLAAWPVCALAGTYVTR